MSTPTEKPVRNVTEAIHVLKKGKKDSRWFEAAEFLIERATPEVKLMLEVGGALAKRELSNQQEKVKPKLTDLVIYGSLIVLATSVVIWLGLSLVTKACD